MANIAKKLELQRTGVVRLLLALYDYGVVVFSYFVGLYVRFDFNFGHIPEGYYNVFKSSIAFYAAGLVVIYWMFRLYNSVLRYVGFKEFLKVTNASFLSWLLYIVIIHFTFGRMPISYYLVGGVLQFILTLLIRYTYRVFLMFVNSREKDRTFKKNVLLIGAGNSGQQLLEDININDIETDERIVCIIDDNPNKWNLNINGVPIVGGKDDILDAVEKYDIKKIYLAIPSATPEQKRDIINICKETECELKTLPSMHVLYNTKITSKILSEIPIEELLGREQIKVDTREILQSLTGKKVMVTGGGGSIGSELCRQIAQHAPASLIIFDVYENNAYEIEQELKKTCPNLNLHTIIGSVRDSERLNQVFETYRPDIVYHAAAHKHVPLMEYSPCEAIKNNAIGTYKTAYAAMANGCKRFVLISTDKAVNPTNIMGASKRLCEMIIQTFDAMVKAGTPKKLPALYAHDGKIEEGSSRKPLPEKVETEFVAVRFGNVLGSNGSVIPLFKKQIAAGGPVTVTHPDIIRYFMTIPEAVSLVLQAGVYAKGGEVFILDMGDPVKIVDLAKNLIRLSGHKVGEDIQIEYTGLRPGEKLFEEKLMAEEGLEKTENELIHIGKPLDLNVEEFLANLEDLMLLACTNQEVATKEQVVKMVDTYQPLY